MNKFHEIMKTLRYFVPALLLFLAVGCYKEFTDNTNNDGVIENMDQLSVDANFDWRLTTNINVNVVSQTPTQVYITSENNDVMYYKGSHPGGNANELIKINVPKTVDRLKVNDHLVQLSGNAVNVDFSSFKAFKASAVNKSFYFYGSNDYGVINDITELNNTAAFTIEGWAKHDLNTANSRLVHKYSDGSNDISVAPYAGDFYVEIGNGSNSYAYWNDYATDIASDTWFHWAAVYDGTQASNSDKLKLYINGVAKTLTFSGTIPSTTSASLSGSSIYVMSDQVPADFFKGNIDDLRFWDHARTQTQINDNKSLELLGTESGLLAYYKFDEYGVNNLETPEASGNHTKMTLVGDYDIETDIPFNYAPDTDSDGVNDTHDDYPNDDTRAYDNYFPAAGFASLGFEDLWPGKGDYDFNDVVVDYRFQIVTNASNEVVEIFGVFPAKASGAFYHNGFGFSLPDAHADFSASPNKLSVSGYEFAHNIISLNTYGHENGQSEPTIIVFDDILSVLDYPGTGFGVNTDEWGSFIGYDTVTITITPTGSYTANDFSLTTWNPFIFAGLTRSHEIHLPDYPPTDLMNMNWFGMVEDDSDPNIGRYYKTVNNLPYAIDIPVEFEWPKEKADITQAYLHFAAWAESAGTLYTNWYEDLVGYRNNTLIYNNIAP